MTGIAGAPETAAAPPVLVGREALLAEVEALLRRGQHVLLFGPADIGKTALIRALPALDVVVIDPFERVGTRRAAAIRRAMGRGIPHLVATRTLDRRRLGAVRRIAFWFTVVRVPPLAPRFIDRLVHTDWRAGPLGDRPLPAGWRRGTVRLAAGRPGVARQMVEAAIRACLGGGALPSPAAAFIQARVRAAGAPALRAP